MAVQGGLPGQRDSISTSPRNIIASYTPEPGYIVGGIVIDATYSYDGSQPSGDEQKLRAGIPMAKITSSKLWAPCKRTRVNGSIGPVTALIVDDARFFKVGDTITISRKGNLAPRVGKVTDDDDAASTGLAVYLHVDELGEGNIGHLESVTAGNADAFWGIANGGPVVRIEDDDAAATLGAAVYFDEDATDPDKRFLATTTTGKDVFVPLSDGSYLRIVYHASPGTPGVQIYFDDDATNVYDRMLFVSPTNVNGNFTTDDEVGSAGESTTLTRSSSNAITAIDYANDTLTITSATVADGDDVYADNTAGIEICRGFLNEYINLVDEDNTARDKLVTKVVNQGFLDASMILGDLDAIRNNPYSVQYIDGILWDDLHGNAA